MDRNVGSGLLGLDPGRSLSARRAWIEISKASETCAGFLVALRKESVDRNPARSRTLVTTSWVALRKESVDRNQHLLQPRPLHFWSLSARRAWIEIGV